MKEKLQDAYKETPERFHYAVKSSVEEATMQQPTAKKRLSKGWRTAIAFALIAALIPSTIFSASKLYQMMAQPVDNHGLEIDVQRESTAAYPEYVKMHVEVPEGFGIVPGTGKMKYYNLSAKEPYTDGFSLYPMRFHSDLEQKEYIENIDSYEERTVNGHQAYEVKMDIGWNRLYIYYEDVNVFLLIYHVNVTEQQLADFIKGITFTEGSASDFTSLDRPRDDRKQASENYDEEFVEYPRDTKVTFAMYSPLTDENSIRCTAQIDNIKIVDNIEGLDPDAFYLSFLPDDETIITDENGWILPKTYNVYKEGSNSETKDEIISSELSNQKLILADITYENLSNEDIELCVPYSLYALEQEDDGIFRYAHIIGRDKKIYSTEYTDVTPIYLTPHGIGSDFYYYTIPAKSTCTFTMGWRCKADMVDKAYLDMTYQNVIVNPPVSDNNPYATYIFKVQ